jgi:quercetin dioxygenase-like cupin family protein
MESSAEDLAEFAARFRAAHEGDPIGPIADRVLLENDRVRIWEMRLEPGQASALHRHDLDYMLIILEGDRIAGVPGPGCTRTPREARVKAGQVFYLARGESEWAVNRGTLPYREILVELKDAPAE